MGAITFEDCVDFLRYMEVAVLAMMSTTFLTDQGPGRGRLAHDLHMLWGYPKWIVPAAGVAQGLICWAAFASEPKRFLAQKMLAALMGGCVHTHVRVAGKLTDAIGAIGFLIVSMIVAWLHHHEDPIAVVLTILASQRAGTQAPFAIHLGLAACGYTAAELARTHFGRPGGGILRGGA
eukprot:CAMPEP_0180121810 /NCGR_PEP_ID=MMETSP0986-20121125/3242_1 /TAXON_ID=697907 /ORGANISM="non described non described, Strain CCMP2293" /LENGTH=177 /DNA_ID=CAMNT_0022060959 /DNA_START=40 /DNA_END=570 /DNA_ORIENTATION=+